jgi:hypothetical protein
MGRAGANSITREEVGREVKKTKGGPNEIYRSVREYRVGGLGLFLGNEF